MTDEAQMDELMDEQGVIVLKDRTARTVPICILAMALILGLATEARAQFFVSPFIGYDFGGDATCPHITNCQDKKLNVGAALGTMGSILGFEEEFAYAKDFFGNSPALSSNVLTLMTNLMVVPAIGPVHPYVLGGLGLIKSHIQFTAASIFTSNNNDLGWDLGGGVIVLLGGHFGVRGDIRYLHSFQDLTIGGLTVSNSKLDFGRAAAGLVVKF
jgi:opacity protein-like surface antigen